MPLSLTKDAGFSLVAAPESPEMLPCTVLAQYARFLLRPPRKTEPEPFSMFEITSDDIALLNDKDLRTLVGLLCEAEMRGRGFPTSSVTWGGHQNAADDGVDVRVALPNNAPIDGFVPRSATVLQVKAENMPRGKILKEMCHKGVIRPVIAELAEQSGAYIIVSSKGSTSDTALRERRGAMVEAVQHTPNANALSVDFYDRTRLATWVRSHGSMVLWVKKKIGKTTRGWHSYDAWAYPHEGVSAEYLVDDSVRFRPSKHESIGDVNVLEGIKRIRDVLARPGMIARLVGLSGLGKTRLVQALFDDRVGEHSLDPTPAFYTNMADDPDPQPTAFATERIAAGSRTILVVDNCPPDLHRRLSDVCRSAESPVSVITVEYDIKDDEPEETEVFRLEPSSNELIEGLVRRRFPTVSGIDARTIADFAGGNARIAIALASTVEKNESLAGLNDADLFQRLFHQRNEPSESLLRAAEACSMVYSFEGEDISNGDEADLVRLGAMVGQSAQDLFRSIAVLKRRDLVQRRGVWRAVLPPAIANRLAALGLQNIPPATIQAQLVRSAPSRLLKSFSRRLGYLDQSNEATAIVMQWLAPGGLLGNIATLDDLTRAMFENVAPTAPEAALSALERAMLAPEDGEAAASCADYIYLIRSIAHDAALFKRCIRLILRIAVADGRGNQFKRDQDVFSSLFFIHFSGTLATIEQRLDVVRDLLRSQVASLRDLGGVALRAVLQTSHFSPPYSFDFGSRLRGYGYFPRSPEEVKHWFRSALKLVEDLGCSDDPSAPVVRAALAETLSGLWIHAGMYDELSRVCAAISKRQFWPDGWVAVRRTLQTISKSPTASEVAQLASLEKILQPSDLVQRVRSIVLSDRRNDYDVDFEGDATDNISHRIERTEQIAQALGKAVASDDDAFGEIAAELVVGEGRLCSFGWGLAEGSEDPHRLWTSLVGQLASAVKDRRRVMVFRGFLSALYAKNPELAGLFLDEAVEDETLAQWFPMLQTAVKIDKSGVNRLNRSLILGKAPMLLYRNLASGRATDQVPGDDFKHLILEIASKEEGFDVASEILYMRLHSEKERKEGCDSQVLDAGRELLQRLKFIRADRSQGHYLGEISLACLVREGDDKAVFQICRRLREAISKYDTAAFYYDDLLSGLFSAQPAAALDGILAGNEAELNLGISILNNARTHRSSPLDTVSEDDLLAWCVKDPRIRYPAVAAISTIYHPTEGISPRQWTAVALRLLEKAPDRVAVLKQFIRQFSPMSWAGSRAAIVAANTKLLDELEAYPDAAVAKFVTEEKVRLIQWVEQEKRQETELDRARDERFE